MSANSKIEWTDATWNPVRGCTIVSKGCTNCYAMRQAHRQSGKRGAYEGLTKMSKGGAVWTGNARVVPDLIEQPLHWKKPRRIFVNSMSDLFHDDVPDDFILRVFDVMRESNLGHTMAFGGERGAIVAAHTFQILTKRPARMLDFCSRLRFREALYLSTRTAPGFNPMTAMRNVWLGVSVEDQAAADERIPLLLRTPAAVRWISAEPLLGPVDLTYATFNGADSLRSLEGLHWVVAGGESGPSARPMHPDWASSLRDQCKRAGVPFFFKQWGQWIPEYNAGELAAGTETRMKGGAKYCRFADGLPMMAIGKKAAGRLLDGRTHDDLPR